MQTEIIGAICKITCSNKFPVSHIIFYPDQSGSMSLAFPTLHLIPLSFDNLYSIILLTKFIIKTLPGEPPYCMISSTSCFSEKCHTMENANAYLFATLHDIQASLQFE